MSATLLEIRRLVVGAGGRKLLCGIDLDLRAGEVMGVIGASGAGKTTLGLAALGHFRPGCRLLSGVIAFRGEDLASLPPRHLGALRGRRLAYVAQSAAAAFNPAHRLLPQITEAPVRHGLLARVEAEREAIHLLERFGLPDPEAFGRRYPHEVSGGQLQRAMIAMAMACRPELVVFDEPTTALDVATQAEVLAVIAEAVEMSGAAALYISHDLPLVARLADRITVLDEGRVVETGHTATVLASPATRQTRAFLHTLPVRRVSAGPAAPAAPVLSLDDVSAAYGSRPVLRHVTIEIPERATVGLVGRSGSGKSTIARVVTGLLRPREGRVRLRGRPLAAGWARRSRADLAAVQLVTQSPDTALNPRHPVGAIVGRPLEIADRLGPRARRERVRSLLSLMDLDPDEFEHRRADTLSGGQKQRVAIARALASEPEVIVCDEITSALDPVAARTVLERLEEARRERGLSCLFISHDLAIVRAIADVVAVLEDGEMVEMAPAAEIFARPQHSVTRHLLAADPRLAVGSAGRSPVPRPLR